MALLDKFKKKKKEPQVEEKIKKKEERPKKEISQQIVVEAYRIIKEPHITEKATFLGEKNKYVFKISSRANKTEVKRIIEALYGVKVAKVHIIHSAAKKRRLGRSQGWKHGLKRGFKKAIITLVQGEKIELLPK